MHYKFCPECGSRLVDRQAGDDGKVPYCEPCRRYWFDSFSSCVIILVANEQDEIALLRQNYLSDRYRSFVSGYIAPGESAEETALREVREELGLELERLEYAGTYWFGMRDQLMHGFIGYAKKREFTLSSEVDGADWVPADDIVELIFPDSPGNTMYPLYRQYLAGRDAGHT